MTKTSEPQKPPEYEGLSDEELLREMENSLKEYDEAGKQFPFQLYEPLGKKHLDFHLDTRGTRLVVGGNRCIHGDTVVSTDGRRVSEIREPFECWAWDEKAGKKVPAVANVPFIKGREAMYSVTVTDSRIPLMSAVRLLATGNHKILTANNGFSSLADMWDRLNHGRYAERIITPDGGRYACVLMPFGYEKERLFDVWDFEVPVYHNYITGGGIINHNSGKSWMTLIEAVFDLVGWWPDFIPEANRAPQPCRLRIVSTSKAVRGRILTFLKQWIPRRVIRNIDARTGTITTFDGNVMELMTFDMDIQAFAGNSLHKCWIDEHLPYESIYNECRMRLLDVNGKMTVDICPWVEDAGGGFTWEYERLYLPAKKGDSDIGCHEFSIHDNPLLTKEQIEKEFSGLTEEEREAREFGRFVRPGGIIFKEYHDAHPWLLRNEVFTLDDKKTREWWQSKATLYWSIDPAATRPNAVLAIGVIGDAIYAVDEIFSDCTAGKLAEKMVKMEEYTGTPSCIIYDYNSDVEERTSGKSFIDVLKEYFDFRKYTWKPSVKRNEEGHIARIKQAFVQNKETGLPSFRVSERCRQFRLELCHWGRNPKTGQPDKKGNDMIDNARYIFAKIPGKTKYGVFEPEWMREARRKGM